MQALTNFRNPAPIPCSLRVTQRAQWYSCEQHCSARCYTNRRRHANAASGYNIYENEGRNTCAANDAFESTFSGSGNRYGSRQASRWGSPRASNALDIPPSPLAFAARAGGSTGRGNVIDDVACRKRLRGAVAGPVSRVGAGSLFRTCVTLPCFSDS